MLTNVILIRHGETMSNRLKHYTGAVDMPLTPEGVEFLREKAASDAYPQVSFAYVSPMIRCRTTKDIIYPNVPEAIVPELRECHFGEFEGRAYEELQFDPAFVAWMDTQGLAQIPGGEGIDDFCGRTIRAFNDTLHRAFSGRIDRVAYCVHGGVIMSIMGYIDGLQPGWHYNYRIDNGCGYALTVDSDDFLTTHKPISIERI